MVYGPRKPGRPKGAKGPGLEALRLDPEDEYLRPLAYLTAKGYATLSQGRTIHRVVTNAPKGTIVDHRDGDKLNNRKENLALGTAASNSRNLGGARKGSKTGLLGVRISPSGKWIAKLRYCNKTLHLGTYSSPQEALRARLLKEVELWGVQPRRKQLLLDEGIITA